MDKKERKRYSEAFKLHVMEELRDGKWKTPTEAAMAYGMPSQNVRNWMRRLGFEHLKGRLIYVKAASERDEIKRLPVAGDGHVRAGDRGLRDNGDAGGGRAVGGAEDGVEGHRQTGRSRRALRQGVPVRLPRIQGTAGVAWLEVEHDRGAALLRERDGGAAERHTEVGYFLDRRFKTKSEALQAIGEAIRIYNTRRLHEKLGYRTPAQFRAEWDRRAA